MPFICVAQFADVFCLQYFPSFHVTKWSWVREVCAELGQSGFFIPTPVIVWGSSVWHISIAFTMERDSKAKQFNYILQPAVQCRTVQCSKFLLWLRANCYCSPVSSTVLFVPQCSCFLMQIESKWDNLRVSFGFLHLIQVLWEALFSFCFI